MTRAFLLQTVIARIVVKQDIAISGLLLKRWLLREREIRRFGSTEERAASALASARFGRAEAVAQDLRAAKRAARSPGGIAVGVAFSVVFFCVGDEDLVGMVVMAMMTALITPISWPQKAQYSNRDDLSAVYYTYCWEPRYNNGIFRRRRWRSLTSL